MPAECGLLTVDKVRAMQDDFATEGGNRADAIVCRKTIRRRGSTIAGRLQCVQRIIVWFAMMVEFSKAQIGTTICICSPSTYEMTFNFSRTCDDNAIAGDGILTTDCAIAPFQNENVTDLVPVSAGSIDILELNESLELLSQSSIFGTFVDGESFSYNSLSGDISMVNMTVFPKALQISVIANNAEGEQLFFAGLVIYATDCVSFPTLLEDSKIGWISFTELQDPLFEVCPLVGTKATSSTAAPTSAPGLIASSPVDRSTKAPSTIRSTKGPTPFRSSKRPIPSAPKTAPPTEAPIHTPPKPTCFHPSSGSGGSSSSSSSGKGKGKGKSKTSKSKSIKSKSIKSKSSKRSKGKGNSKKSSKHSSHYHYGYDYDYYHERNDNIFDHEECGSSKASGRAHSTPTPTKAPVEHPAASGSSDWSWDDGAKVYTEEIPTNDSGRAKLPDYPTKQTNGELEDRDSVNKSSEEESSTQTKTGVESAFGSMATMVGVLTGGVVVAIVAILVWKRPDPAYMCGKSSSASAVERENMVISLVKGMNGR